VIPDAAAGQVCPESMVDVLPLMVHFVEHAGPLSLAPVTVAAAAARAEQAQRGEPEALAQNANVADGRSKHVHLALMD